MGMNELPELAGHSRKVYALGWNACGTRLASGSTDKSIRLWDIDTSVRGNDDIDKLIIDRDSTDDTWVV